MTVLTKHKLKTQVLVAGGGPAGVPSSASGIGVESDGTVYVADFQNHRVQVFGSDGEPQRTIGSEGHEAGQLYYPTDVVLGADGTV